MATLSRTFMGAVLWLTPNISSDILDILMHFDGSDGNNFGC
jgi:hypothetical protein